MLISIKKSSSQSKSWVQNLKNWEAKILGKTYAHHPRPPQSDLKKWLPILIDLPEPTLKNPSNQKKRGREFKRNWVSRHHRVVSRVLFPKVQKLYEEIGICRHKTKLHKLLRSKKERTIKNEFNQNESKFIIFFSMKFQIKK